MPLGTVVGHRGRGGEVTVRLGSGEDAAPWTALRRVRIEDGRSGDARTVEIERARAYRDRLVLKLRGVDDATAAGRLRGARVTVAREDAAPLPEGRHYRAALVGLRVEDERGQEIGEVVDVVGTGGQDLLCVRPAADDGGAEELLIPFVREIVTEVDEAGGRIRVRPPEGLLTLNR